MYQKNHFESQTIRWSVIVLCVSLILVYIVLYYAKGDFWKTDLSANQINTGDILVTDLNVSGYQNDEYSFNTGDNTGNISIDNDYSGTNLTGNITGNNLVFNTNIGTGKVDNDQKNSLEELESMIILSGTKTYYGELDFVDKLGISYKYALVDKKGIYYVNMGDYKYDFSDIARKLKGSLYVINTDQELISNSLFGDKVTFINIPEYKNTKVLFLLNINNQSWLLATDYEMYHQVKPYLKSLFIY